MTNFTTKMMIAAAAMAASAGLVSAQSLNAEIPFAFRAGNTQMAPGAYQVRTVQSAGGAPVLSIRGANGTVMVLAMTTIDRNAAAPAKLVFECAGSQCVLAEAWKGGAYSGYRFNHAKLSKDEPHRMATVLLTTATE